MPPTPIQDRLPIELLAEYSLDPILRFGGLRNARAADQQLMLITSVRVNTSQLHLLRFADLAYRPLATGKKRLSRPSYDGRGQSQLLITMAGKRYEKAGEKFIFIAYV